MNQEQINKIKNTVEELQKSIRDQYQLLRQEFESGIAEILKNLKDSKIKSISMYLNNHDFNDGEATYFSLYYDDLRLLTNRGREYDGYPKNKELDKVRDNCIEFFKQFDVDNFYEKIYGEFGSGTLTFSLNPDETLNVDN